MTYVTYYIHPQTLSVNVRNFYKKYDCAVRNLKDDASEYIKSNKNLKSVEFVNKKKEITNKEDGYYLKLSNKYPNRISIYEKNTERGWTYNFYNIKKVVVFSLMELASMPDGLNLDVTVKETRKMIKPKNNGKNQIQILYLEELKAKIIERLEKDKLKIKSE